MFSRDSNEVLRLCYEVRNKAGIIIFVHMQENEGRPADLGSMRCQGRLKQLMEVGDMKTNSFHIAKQLMTKDWRKSSRKALREVSSKRTLRQCQLAVNSFHGLRHQELG